MKLYTGFLTATLALLASDGVMGGFDPAAQQGTPGSSQLNLEIRMPSPAPLYLLTELSDSVLSSQFAQVIAFVKALSSAALSTQFAQVISHVPPAAQSQGAGSLPLAAQPPLTTWNGPIAVQPPQGAVGQSIDGQDQGAGTITFAAQSQGAPPQPSVDPHPQIQTPLGATFPAQSLQDGLGQLPSGPFLVLDPSVDDGLHQPTPSAEAVSTALVSQVEGSPAKGAKDDTPSQEGPFTDPSNDDALYQ